MIAVFQCAKCSTIVGDTDLVETQLIKGEEGIEVKHLAAFENLRGRIRCEECKESIGVEDDEGRVFLLPSQVKKYVVQSAKPDVTSKRIKPSSFSGEHVTYEEFQELKQSYEKDISDCKETIMALFEKLDRMGG